jgi:hypothetical protein
MPDRERPRRNGLLILVLIVLNLLAMALLVRKRRAARDG